MERQNWSWLLSPAAAYLVSRTLVLCILIAVSAMELTAVPAIEGKNYHLSFEWKETLSRERLEKILRSADARWYLEIADAGYHQPKEGGTLSNPGARNWALFPLFPLFIQSLSPVFGSSFLAALVISNVSFFLSLLVLYQLVLNETQSPSVASRSVWLLAFFPFSYFAIAPFTEPLFLLLTLLAFVLLFSNRAILSGLVMALASACRPTGLLILPGYALLSLLCVRRGRIPLAFALFGLTLAPLGAAAYAYYLYTLTGDPLAFSTNQLQWGRQSVSVDSLGELLRHGPFPLSRPWDFRALNLSLAFLTVFASGVFFLKRNWHYGLCLLVPIVVVLASGTTQSMGRFVFVAFPLFLLLGEVAEKRPIIERSLFVVSAFLLALMTLMYGLHLTAAMA